MTVSDDVRVKKISLKMAAKLRPTRMCFQYVIPYSTCSFYHSNPPHVYFQRGRVVVVTY